MSSEFITQREACALINSAQEQAPAASRYQLTHAEAVDRAQLLALFDRSDERGQLLLLQIAAIHADRYPKEK